jgi:hypothetical protein
VRVGPLFGEVVVPSWRFAGRWLGVRVRGGGEKRTA